MTFAEGSSQPTYTSSHDADDFDALIMRRRREAGLPEMADPNTEADNEGDW